MRYLVLSDLHFNCLRQGGTTDASRIALDDHLFVRAQHIINTIPHDKIIIVGDWSAKNSVSEKTILKSYNLLKDREVIMLRGNHDEGSMRLGEICGLELLGALLPKTQLVFHEPQTIDGMCFIPHTFDQKTFDAHLDLVGERQLVFLHANYANSFAEHADHSLNFSGEQHKVMREKGNVCLLGHEHAQRDLDGLYILGCTYPTSISDCLGGSKRVMVYDSETGTFESIETWNQEEDYIEIPWQDIRLTNHNFVRIVGECSVVEYPEIVRNVGKLRKESSAFIVANAVKAVVEEREQINKEEITGFNILELLLENVDEEFREEVKVCI